MALPVGAALQAIAQLWYERPELAAGAYAVGAIAATVPRYVPTFDQTKSWLQRDTRSSTHVGVRTTADITDNTWFAEQDTMSYPVITVPRFRPSYTSLPANHEMQTKPPQLARCNSFKATASSPMKDNLFFPNSTCQTSIGSIVSNQATTSPAGILAPTEDAATCARDLAKEIESTSSTLAHSTSDHGPTPPSAMTSEPTQPSPDQEHILATANIDEYGGVDLYPLMEQRFREKISVVHAALVAYPMRYHASWLIVRNYCSALGKTMAKAVPFIKLFMSTLLLHMPGSLPEVLGKPYANHLLIVRATFAVLVGIVLSFPCIMDAVTSRLCICATVRHTRHAHPRLANLHPKPRLLLFGINRLADCCIYYLSSYIQDLVAVFATEALIFTLCWIYMDKEFLPTYALQVLKLAIIGLWKGYKILLGFSRFIRRFSSVLALLALMPIAIYITMDPEQPRRCLEQYSENTPLPPIHNCIYYTLMVFVVIAFIRPILDTIVSVGQFFADVYIHVRLHTSSHGAPARPTTYIGHIRWLPEISRFCLFMTHNAVMTLLGPSRGAAVMVVLAWLITIFTIPLWLVLLMTLWDAPYHIHAAKHWTESKTESTRIRVDLVANPNKQVVSRMLASSSTAINTALSHVARGGKILEFLFKDCAKPVLVYLAQSCHGNWCRVLAWRWLWRTPDYMIIFTTAVVVFIIWYLWGQVPIEMRAAFEEVSAGFPGRNSQRSGSQSLSVSSAGAPSSSGGLTDDEDDCNYSGSSPSEDVDNLSPKSARSEDSMGSILSSNVGRRKRRAASNSLRGNLQTPTSPSSEPAIPPPGSIIPPFKSALPRQEFRLLSPPPLPETTVPPTEPAVSSTELAVPPAEPAAPATTIKVPPAPSYPPLLQQSQATSLPSRPARADEQLFIEDFPLPDLYTRPASRPTDPVLSESAERWRNEILGGPSFMTTERRGPGRDLSNAPGWPGGGHPGGGGPYGGGGNGGGKSGNSEVSSNPSDAATSGKGGGHVPATESTTQQPPGDSNTYANNVGGAALNAETASAGATFGQAAQPNTNDDGPESGTAVSQMNDQGAPMTENNESQSFVGSKAPPATTNTLEDEEMSDAPDDGKAEEAEGTGDNNSDAMDLEPAAEEIYKSFQLPAPDADPMNLDDFFPEADTTLQIAAPLPDNVPNPGSSTSSGWLFNAEPPNPATMASEFQIFLGHRPQGHFGGSFQTANPPPYDPCDPIMRPEESRSFVDEQTSQDTGSSSVAPNQTANVASTDPVAMNMSALPEGQNTQSQITDNSQRPNNTQDTKDPQYTNLRPLTRLVQIWPANEVVENPDFAEHRAAGMKSLRRAYGESCKRYREVSMKAYDEYGEFTSEFQEAQRNIAWFDLSWEGVEQGPVTQSAGERTNCDGERNEDAFSEDSDAYDEDGDSYDGDEDPSDEDHRERPAQRTFTGDDGLLYTLDRPQTSLIQMQHDMSIIENPDYWYSRKKRVKKVETMFGMGMTWREVDVEAYNDYGKDSTQFDAAQLVIPWFYVFQEGADESDWDEDNSESSSSCSDSDSGLSDAPDDYVIDAAGTELGVEELNSMLRRRGAHRDSDSDQDFQDVPIRRRLDEDRDKGEDEELDSYELFKGLQEPSDQAQRSIITGIDIPLSSPHQQEAIRSRKRAILIPRAPPGSERHSHRSVSPASPPKPATTPNSPQALPNPYAALLSPSKSEATPSPQRGRQMSHERNYERDGGARKVLRTSGSFTGASVSESELPPIPPQLGQEAEALGITDDTEIRNWITNRPQRVQRSKIATPKLRKPQSADAMTISAPVAPPFAFDTPIYRPINASDDAAIAVEQESPAQSSTDRNVSPDSPPAYRSTAYESAQSRND